jgi:hypothetical protein
MDCELFQHAYRRRAAIIFLDELPSTWHATDGWPARTGPATLKANTLPVPYIPFRECSNAVEHSGKYGYLQETAAKTAASLPRQPPPLASSRHHIVEGAPVQVPTTCLCAIYDYLNLSNSLQS